jgi:hypothetical protein
MLDQAPRTFGGLFTFAACRMYTVDWTHGLLAIKVFHEHVGEKWFSIR